MTQHLRSLSTAFVLIPLLAAGSAGCDETELAPSDVGGTPIVETFIGTVAVGGRSFYSFTVPNQGPVLLTLLTLTENGEPTEARVGLGIGTPLGVGCTAPVSAAAGPSSTPNLRQVLPPAIYCAQVSDTGQLTATASFALNITHPR